MGKTNRYGKCLLTALSIACLSATVACASSPEEQQGIDAYQVHNYRLAIDKLSHAKASNQRAHYYLALAFQAVGSMSQAEKEYLWGYNNDRDRDLRYKSWQGLQGLSQLKGARQSYSGAASTASAGTPGKLNPSEAYVGQDTTKPQSDEIAISHTAGCGRHGH